MAVVWNTDLDSEIPTRTSLTDYGKPAADVHHHHFHHLARGHNLHLNALAESIFRHKRQSNGDIASWTPDSDVRETKLAYHIDLELPGVIDKKDILIQWMSPHTVLVEGKAMRPGLTRGREATGEAMWESDLVSDATKGSTDEASKNDNFKDGGACVRCADTAEERTMRLIHGERKIGAWRRYFTLPIDADMRTLKAGLQAGLLHISVFKKEGAGEGFVTVEIE